MHVCGDVRKPALNAGLKNLINGDVVFPGGSYLKLF